MRRRIIRFYLVVTRNINSLSEISVDSAEEIDISFDWDEKEDIMRVAFRALDNEIKSDDRVTKYHWNDWEWIQ